MRSRNTTLSLLLLLKQTGAYFVKCIEVTLFGKQTLSPHDLESWPKETVDCQQISLTGLKSLFWVAAIINKKKGNQYVGAFYYYTLHQSLHYISYLIFTIIL